MDGTRQVIASTVFVPVANPGPVVTAYMRNCSGTAGQAVPTTIGVGNWQVNVPGAFDQLRISMVGRAYSAAGVNRLVTVVIDAGANPTTDPTTLNIFLRDDAGAVSDDALFVEVTMARLPL